MFSGIVFHFKDFFIIEVNHILIITYNDYPVYEGLGVRIRNLSRNLLKEGFHVTIIAPNIDNRRPLYEILDGIQIIRFNIYLPGLIKKIRIPARFLSMVIQFFSAFNIYRKHLRERKVDLIIAEHIYSLPFAIRIKKLKKSLLYVDDIIAVTDILRATRLRILAPLFKRFESTLFKHADDFISTSPVSYDYYKQRGAISRISIPNGVDSSLFKPCSSINENLVVFFNGSTYSDQNRKAACHFISIGEEIASKKEKGINFRLICWPFYNLDSSVQNLIRKKPLWFSYLPGAENIEEEIGKADITILPYEKGHGLTGGTRLKALEYMACGKLVISTVEGILGIQGLVSGEHFVLATDLDEFPQLILKYADWPEERRRIGDNGRKFVLENYDWSVTTRPLIDRLKSLRI